RPRRDTGVMAERLTDRLVRPQRLFVPPAVEDEPAVLLDSPRHLGRDAGLADTSVAGDERQGTCSSCCSRPRRLEAAQLLVPPDEDAGRRGRPGEIRGRGVVVSLVGWVAVVQAELEDVLRPAQIAQGLPAAIDHPATR